MSAWESEKPEIEMSEKTLYQKIGELNPDRNNELITVISGKDAGKKVLLTDGTVTALSDGADAGKILDMPGECLLRERLGHRKTLVVCGAGYVGQGVIRLGKFLGFRVLALDDRIDFAAAAKKAGAEQVFADDFAVSLRSGKIPFDEDTYFAVMTRGHRFDRECLLEIMKHPFAYAGMMGSRARSARMRQTLAEEGIPKEKAELLHAPIGVKIGAQTPEEIAVSVLGEIIQEKAAHPGKDVFPEEILSGIEEAGEGQCVLATITERRGSAPRRPGTRMLVRRDHTTAGTIGGGCMEAEVIREAAMLLADGESSQEVFSVDLTGRTGEEADMLCGGAMDLLLEVL